MSPFTPTTETRRALLSRQTTPFIEPLERRSLLSTTFSAAINFQPDGPPAVGGYAVDAGTPYAARADGLTYGWDQDVSKRTRARESDVAPDARYETFIAPSRSTWNLAVPNGDYDVRIAAGDGKKGRRAKVDVEGVLALDAKSTKESRWVENVVRVTVADGTLTIAPADGYKNNRLNFVTVSPAGTPAPGAPSAPSSSGPFAIDWTPGAAQSPQTRVEGGVAHVGTKLYVFGGYVSGFDVDNTSDVFDAATSTWTRGPDFLGAQTHAAVASDGVRMIYKVSGQEGGGVPGTPTRDAWRYDPKNDKWKELPALPDARYAAGSAVVGNKLYVFGGTGPDRTTVMDTTWVLDLKKAKRGWQTLAPIPAAGDHISTVVIGDKIYAVGGEHGHAASLPESEAAYVQHANLYRYDPSANAWEKLADPPQGRSHAEGTTVVVNGKIVFMGGKLSAADVSDRIDLYDPATNAWTTSTTKLPQMNQGGAAIVHDGRIYLSHGQEGAPDHTMWRSTWVGVPAGV